MKKDSFFRLLLTVALLLACQSGKAGTEQNGRTGFDWLVNPEKSSAYVKLSDDGRELTVGNAMVSRTFRLAPDLSTISIRNLMIDEEMIRAASPEGTLCIDGKEYPIGGLSGQKERGYLKSAWLDEMEACGNAFHLQGYTEGVIEENIRWARSRWALNKENATGRTVTFTLRGEAPLDSVTVRVIVAVYDRLPVISKQIEVTNEGSRPFCIDAFRLEHLSFSEPDSPVSSHVNFMTPNIHVESDFNVGGAFTHQETDATTNWVTDPDYKSQRNYQLKTPCILDVNPPVGPSQIVGPKDTFRTFTVYEMPFDSYDRERQGLFQRRFYRAVVPWTTENPIFLHLTTSDPEKIRVAVDQAAETGYEMVIISFGSGLNMEDLSDANIARYKEVVDYAAGKGIEMGCYSLLASRHVNEENDCINPRTGKSGGMIYGYMPCLGSEWGEEYLKKIERFLTETGMKCLEHDGSYPGDVCASVNHPGHRGLEDSQWAQFYRIAGFYRRMCEKGVYLNVPDYYWFNGSTKTAIGYREVNWSLPRDRQILHTRQLNYDCTWTRPQSACWSFVPLTQYHGGGKEATIEPLQEHLDVYKALMFQNYSTGVQACYRGPRLYDTDSTRRAVVGMISWYKQYRRILNSDIIHLRKPDARDWDGIMHVRTAAAAARQNEMAAEEGIKPLDKDVLALAVFYNPLDEDIVRTVRLPLYYTGLTKTARIRREDGKLRTFRLDRDYTVELTVSIPANGYTWYAVE